MPDTPFDAFLIDDAKASTPLVPLSADLFPRWRADQPASVNAWIDANGFDAKAGQTCLLPAPDGAAGRALFGLGPADPAANGKTDPDAAWFWAGLPAALPGGSYHIEGGLPADAAAGAALAWGLGTYQFNRFKTSANTAEDAAPSDRFARLVWPGNVDKETVLAEGRATFLCRDLINTPANHMGPSRLAEAAERLAAEHRAECSVIAGDDLLAKNYPAIHAVGRAAADEPRLIDVRWGGEANPRVTLVGKGVCFDTGGLDLKPASGMKLMKKDMGGAAHVLGMAHILMALRVPIRLRVLISAVENSVSSNAMRPLDVVDTRSGKTVEISNTDAEGRVILSDALTEAVSENPALLIDFATLTGAARVALGAELPALFCNDDTLAADILSAGAGASDNLWRMPLWAGYRAMVDARTGDLDNAPEGGLAGAITAALFLEHFVGLPGAAPPWAHVDVMAWNNRKRLGRPVGGEAMGLRAMARMVVNRFRTGEG